MMGGARQPLCERRLTDRGVSAAVGVVLLVAMVVITATVVGVTSLGVTEQLDQPGPLDGQIKLEPDAAGTSAYVQGVRSPVEIRINGETVYTATPGDTGEELFLPTAPGDKVTVVSSGAKQEVLLRETVDPASGDYMLHYPLVAGSGTQISDESEHSNYAELGKYDGSSFTPGASTRPSWVETADGTGLRFDGPGSDQAAKTTGIELNEDDEVEQFTVAVKFNSHSNTGDIQQLVEHRNGSASWEWFMESDVANVGAADEFAVDFEVHFPDNQITRTDPLTRGNTHVVVGTYTGENMNLYVNGSKQDSRSVSGDLSGDPAYMGDLWVGADLDCGCGQYLDGDLYELRLYYTALDDDEVQRVSDAMMTGTE
jgi:hypothetical protein